MHILVSFIAVWSETNTLKQGIMFGIIYMDLYFLTFQSDSWLLIYPKGKRIKRYTLYAIMLSHAVINIIYSFDRWLLPSFYVFICDDLRNFSIIIVRVFFGFFIGDISEPERWHFNRSICVYWLSAFFRCMQIHASVFEVQDTICWHRWLSVYWEFSSTEEMTHSQHPFPILTAPRWIWFIPDPKHPGMDRDPDTGNVCGPWQAFLCENKSSGCENSLQWELIPSFAPPQSPSLWNQDGPEWEYYRFAGWQDPRQCGWPSAKHFMFSPFLEMLTHCFREGSLWVQRKRWRLTDAILKDSWITHEQHIFLENRCSPSLSLCGCSHFGL